MTLLEALWHVGSKKEKESDSPLIKMARTMMTDDPKSFMTTLCNLEKAHLANKVQRRKLELVKRQLERDEIVAIEEPHVATEDKGSERARSLLDDLMGKHNGKV